VKNKQLSLVGRQIRKFREAKGISQEEFASLANLDRAYYGGIERGERNLATLNLIKIAAALDVEVGDLIPKLTELGCKWKGE
jgi:transcriptional regulator with XRE-family HTH domain